MVSPDFEPLDAIAKAREIITKSAKKNWHTSLGASLYDKSQGKEKLAQEILGSDFLGIESIQKMFSYLNTLRFNISLPGSPEIPFSPENLEQAAEQDEMLIYRPQKIFFNGEETDVDFPLLMRMFQYNIQNQLIALEDSHLWQTDLYNRDTKINGGWTLVRKSPLSTTGNLVWNSQDQYLDIYQELLLNTSGIQNYVKRRNITDALWDTVLYTATKKQPILQGVSDWTSTRVFIDPDFQYLEITGQNVLNPNRLATIRPVHPFHPNPYRGVCPSRFVQ